MSPHTARIRDYALNALITLIATVFLLFGTGAWSLKENVADHNRDILQITNKLDRLLDAVCDKADGKPRACSSSQP